VTRLGYKHLRIEHQAKEYVRGKIHTNSIEGFWSLLKRGIGGVYHSVSEKYLQSYINEHGFRYNHRKDEKPMFLYSFCHQWYQALRLVVPEATQTCT